MAVQRYGLEVICDNHTIPIMEVGDKTLRISSSYNIFEYLYLLQEVRKRLRH